MNFTNVPNELIEIMMRAKISNRASRVFYCVIRLTLGYNRTSYKIKNSDMVKLIEVDKYGVSKAIRELINGKFITKNRLGEIMIDCGVDITKFIDQGAMNGKKLSKTATKSCLNRQQNGKKLSNMTTNSEKKLSKTTTPVVPNDNKNKKKLSNMTTKVVDLDNSLYIKEKRKFFKERERKKGEKKPSLSPPKKSEIIDHFRGMGPGSTISSEVEQTINEFYYHHEVNGWLVNNKIIDWQNKIKLWLSRKNIILDGSNEFRSNKKVRGRDE